MIKKIAVSLLLLCGLLVLVGSNLDFIEQAIVFRSQILPDSHVYSSDSPYEEVILRAPDGAILNGLHFKAPNSNGVVLYFHGRGNHLERWANWVKDDFLSRGQDVVIFDYRGFGKSRGARSMDKLLSDCVLWHRYVQLQYAPEQITIYGRSLGTGFATYVAAHFPCKQLILEAPYYSLLDLAEKTFPLIPSWLHPTLVRYPMRTDLWLPCVKSPVYILHGTSDQLIPFNSSERLHQLGHSAVTLIPIPEADHSGITLHVDYKELLDRLFKSAPLSEEWQAGD